MNHLLKISNFIGGKSAEPLSGKYLDNYEPAIGQVYSLIPDSDQNDVQVAVDAARKAFPSWSAMSNDDQISMANEDCARYRRTT
jgi:acyl-CoA reductase-like NAD-dependent aldehyde dehydrogenase